MRRPPRSERGSSPLALVRRRRGKAQGKALDDDDVVIAAAKAVLARFLVRRALVPALRFLERRELDDRDTFDRGPLLHLATAEASEERGLVTRHEGRCFLRVQLKLARVAGT